MAAPTNFLLGFGERLTAPIEPPLGGAPKTPPYTFSEAQARLMPMMMETAQSLQGLRALACPADHAVAVLTMHPQYLAKSYFPGALLMQAELRALGSRPTKVLPEKWTRKGAPELVETTELFVSGPRRAFRQLPARILSWTESTRGSGELSSLEKIRPLRASERIAPGKIIGKSPVFEAVLHASPETTFVLDGFESFLASLGVKADFDRRFFVEGLCFLPLEIPRELVDVTAEFSFLRVLRQMPRLRVLKPPVRSISGHGFKVELPSSPAVNAEARVAIFDGGLKVDSPLTKWVQAIDAPGVGDAVPEFLEHGHDVTSAAIFGPLEKGRVLEIPYSKAHHYRVLDANSVKEPIELYDVLKRISTVLETNRYEFINLSIGPDLPIEDTEVHGWTAFFDSYLADGRTLATIAAGNGGESDRESGNARIQSPSDCVNAMSIGACDSRRTAWRRASYSCFGPGRSPGIIKPDLLNFGGSGDEPFWVINPTCGEPTRGTKGTSFASPATLRTAVGVRTYLGSVVSPLAVKALLIHCSDDSSENRVEHGWGRAPSNLEEIIVCPDNSARIVYQGQLTPAQYLRAQIPIPAETLQGDVHVTATFCYATETDPQDPGNYTRSGLDITFRPHSGKREPQSLNAKSAPFFQLRHFSEEQELRRDAHKWETTLHRKVTKRGASLKNPVFDIHYNARSGGAPTKAAPKLHYALIVTVCAPKSVDLYNKIFRRYATYLQPLSPVLTIPVRT